VLLSVNSRCWFLCLAAGLALMLSACQEGGHFCILGYTTQPNYDLTIHTVYVPIFKNTTFSQGLEFELTRAVIREIEAKTPYKVASCREQADSELIGTITARNKQLINYNQLGEVREVQTTLTVDLIWRDLRPGHAGEILSKPNPGPRGEPLVIKEGQSAPSFTVQSQAGFIPEIGQSLATALKDNCDRLAVQIVSMMEKPW
jgi:hypothetical protein